VAGFYTQGFLHTWEQLPYADLSLPWWQQDANSVFRLNNKQFAAVGAHSLAMYSRGFVMLYNKDMFADLGITENLYNLVREGKWTADKFAETAKQAVTDLNGDGAMDGSDRYGMSTAVKLHFGSLITGAGVKYIDTDEQGNPYFAIPGNVYALDVMQKILNLHKDTNIFLKVANDVHGGSGDGQIVFGNQQALFVGVSTKGIANFRDYEFDIGILPYPKYSEQQENYYTLTSGTGVSVLPVTMDTARFEKVGLLIEALARDSYRGVLPAYKETTLKTKYARDEDSSDMLDIIFGSLTFDLGLSVFPGDTYYAYMENYLRMNDNFVSVTERLDTAKKAVFT
jgi:ABC-type glycerol-3-phosphate transport system substrate-binding protein